MSLTKSDWTYEVHKGVLCITDLDLGRMSVTNDIENIIPILIDKCDQDHMLIEPLKDNKVIYCDSDGCWDRVNISGSKTIGFEVLPRSCKNKDQAVECLLHKVATNA